MGPSGVVLFTKLMMIVASFDACIPLLNSIMAEAREATITMMVIAEAVEAPALFLMRILRNWGVSS